MRTVLKIACLLVLTLSPRSSSAQGRAASLRIEPSEIPIGLFYSGTEVRVTGVTQKSENLVLLCTGKASTVQLKEKGRVWGLLWINTADISFDNVPSLYQIASSGKLSYSPAQHGMIPAGAGFPALETQTGQGTGEERRNRCFSELIKLKKHEGLYSIREGGLELHPLTNGWQEFSARFYFPPDVGQGTYRFRLINFGEGKEVELAEGEISVRLAGVAAFIRSLSLDHGLIYGLFSVVIALIAGLLTGMLFGRRPRKFGH